MPLAHQFEVAEAVKERFGYCCANLTGEYEKYDQDPEKFLKRFDFIEPIFKKTITINVGHEVRAFLFNFSVSKTYGFPAIFGSRNLLQSWTFVLET